MWGVGVLLFLFFTSDVWISCGGSCRRAVQQRECDVKQWLPRYARPREYWAKYLIVLFHLAEAEHSYLPPNVIKWSTMKIQLWVLYFQRLKASDVRHHASPGEHTRLRCSGGLRYYNRGLRIHLRGGSRPFSYAASARWCYTRMTDTLCVTCGLSPGTLQFNRIIDTKNKV